jgi:hypothetical protein
MATSNINIAAMKQLLEKFHPDITFSATELKKIETCIFSGMEPLLLFVQAEVEQTISYLQEVKEECRCKSVQDLLAYYKDMEMDGGYLISSALTSEFPREQKKLDFKGGVINLFYKLPEQIENNYIKLALHFTDCFQVYYNNLKKRNKLRTLFSDTTRQAAADNSSETKLRKPLGVLSKAYLEQFSFQDVFQDACEKVFILSGFSAYQRQIVARKMDDISFQPEPPSPQSQSGISKVFNTVLRDSLEPYYCALITRVSTEEPIESEDIKLKLTEWLFFHKLRTLDAMGLLKSDYDNLLYIFDEMESKQNRNKVLTFFTNVLRDYATNIYRSKLSEKEWIILKCPFGDSWLTSDNPGFSIPQEYFSPGFEKTDPDPTLITIEQNSMVYFPLSKKYCLRIKPTYAHGILHHPIKTAIRFEEASEKEFKMINNLTVKAHKDMIISGNKRTLEQLGLIANPAARE